MNKMTSVRICWLKLQELYYNEQNKEKDIYTYIYWT